MLLCNMQQVVVYMQPQLSQPVRVYLSTQPGGSNAKQRLFPEVVEASSTLTNIQQLLTQHQLTCMPFPPPAQNSSIGGAATAAAAAAGSAQGSARTSSSSSSGGQAGAGAIGSSNVVVKRQDGSCCSKVQVEEGCTVQELLEAVWEVEVGCCAASSEPQSSVSSMLRAPGKQPATPLIPFKQCPVANSASA